MSSEYVKCLSLYSLFVRELKSVCRALYYQRDKIPEDRKNELLAKLKELCPDEEDFSDEFLKSNVNIDTT